MRFTLHRKTGPLDTSRGCPVSPVSTYDQIDDLHPTNITIKPNEGFGKVYKPPKKRFWTHHLFRRLSDLLLSRRRRTGPIVRPPMPRFKPHKLKDEGYSSSSIRGDGDQLKYKSEYQQVLAKWYELYKVIGKGAFSKVYLARHKFTGEFVAIKIVNKRELGVELNRIYLEVEALKSFDHPYICKLFQLVETDELVFMVLEYCKCDVFESILKHKMLKEHKVKRIFKQVASAVDYIHSKGYAHRDLKPENIMLDWNGDVKLIDFNLCGKFASDLSFERKKLSTNCGSPNYAAPELLRGDGEQYDGVAIDSWSLGVTLYTMLCGNLPFEGPQSPHHSELRLKILNAHYEIPEYLSKGSINLIKNLIKLKPGQRLTPVQVVRDQWLNSAQKDYLVLKRPQFDDTIDEEILELISNQMMTPVNDLGLVMSMRDFSTGLFATYNILRRKKEILGPEEFLDWKSEWKRYRDMKSFSLKK